MAELARVTELIKKIADDQDLRERLTAATDPERRQIVDELGFGDVTPADIAANAVHFTPAVARELDDAELEAVTGGGDTITTTTTTTTVTAAASAAVAT